MFKHSYGKWVTATMLGLLFTLCDVGTAHAYMLRTTKSGEQVRWSSSVVTMYVDEKLAELFGRDAAHAAIEMATEAWRGLPGVPDLVVSDDHAAGFDPERRTNGVYLMRDWPYGDNQLAVTVSTYDSSGRILGADVLVNGNKRFAVLAEDGEQRLEREEHDLGAVLTHEMGHVLGLGENEQDEAATMWPYIRAGEVHQRSLSEDDEAGAIAAYAYKAGAGPAGCGANSVAGAGLRAGQLPAMVVAALGALLLSRRRGH